MIDQPKQPIRVLIVGTVPYKTKSTSRAFDSYFHYWKRENIAQIFSNTKAPVKGHCGTLYQITDYRMLKRWINPNVDTGVVYNYGELKEEFIDSSDSKIDSTIAETAYKAGRKHTSLTHLMRGLLWRKKFWCTEELNAWLDAFKPQCVFLAFSDDYFISNIALYAAKKYDIPIVSCIGDDYYFNLKMTLNPVYWLYKLTYRSLTRKVLSWRGSAIYISNKIRDKYNNEFNLDGETVYLSSNIQRKAFKPIDTGHPTITYFGNIRIGRNKSLNDIGKALGEINPEYILQIYSNEEDYRYYSVFVGNPNVKVFGAVSYKIVEQRMAESDINIVVEGFSKKDINCTRYSLSTKAADALACGASILAYGPAESGLIEYMRDINAAEVCTRQEDLVDCIKNLMGNRQKQELYYDNAVTVTSNNHTKDVSCAISEAVIRKAVNKAK